MRILIVEDDERIANSLKKSLEEACFSVDISGDGEEGSFLGRTNNYDLIVLDNMLPKKNGLRVCQEIRKKNKATKILMLSVKKEIQEKVALLDGGADDYMTKPFSFSELLSRIKALLRRSDIFADDSLNVQDLTLDLKTFEVRQGKRIINLTRKEFMLLEFLIRNINRVVTPEEIMEHVWDGNLDVFSNTLRSHMGNLRRKIEKEGNKKLIETICGRGYIIRAD